VGEGSKKSKKGHATRYRIYERALINSKKSSFLYFPSRPSRAHTHIYTRVRARMYSDTHTTRVFSHRRCACTGVLQHGLHTHERTPMRTYVPQHARYTQIEPNPIPNWIESYSEPYFGGKFHSIWTETYPKPL